MNRPSIGKLYQQHAYIVEEVAKINRRIERLTAKQATVEAELQNATDLNRVKRRKLQQERYTTGKTLQTTTSQQQTLVQNLHYVEAQMLEWNQTERFHTVALPMQYYPYYVPPPASLYGYTPMVDPGRAVYAGESWQQPAWDFSTTQLAATPAVSAFQYPYEQAYVAPMQQHPGHRDSGYPGSYSPDSGFVEPSTLGVPSEESPDASGARNALSHEILFPTLSDNFAYAQQARTVTAGPSTAQDELISPKTIPMTAPARLEADSEPWEVMSSPSRYSEHAVQLIEARLKKKGHSHGASSVSHPPRR